MADSTNQAAGSIYDLGYRQFEGERLGRPYAIYALFFDSCKGVFGLGRSTLNKVFPIGLAGFLLVPAFLQLAIAALLPADFKLVEPQSYFGYVQVVVALFCAVVAPELIGRDQRNRTLTLYFSRALARHDYVFSKLAALIAALLLVILVPQAILFLGNAVATDKLVDYFLDNISEVPPILASSAVIAFMLASISLALATQTSKRPLATGIVIAYFVIFTTLGRTLLDTTTGDVRAYVLLISPFDVLDGTVYWLFSVSPPEQAAISQVEVQGAVYLVTALAYSAVSLAWLYRRLQRLVV